MCKENFWFSTIKMSKQSEYLLCYFLAMDSGASLKDTVSLSKMEIMMAHTLKGHGYIIQCL